jgi:hypothetical protein
LEVKVKENKIYNGKQNIFQSHEENWLKKKLVKKTLKNLNQNVLALTGSFWSF